MRLQRVCNVGLFTLLKRACWAPCTVQKLKEDVDMQIVYTGYRNEGAYSKYTASSPHRPVGLMLRMENVAV